MIFMYQRVSSESQNLDRQKALEAKYKVDKVFSEKVSGKSIERPQLQLMLEVLSEGDTVVVESYSRLSRSTKDLLMIVDSLKDKGVSFISDKENVDTTTPTGKLFFSLIASIIEYEREILLQRQKEGIKQARERGVYKGRKAVDFNIHLWKTYYPKIESGELSNCEAMDVMGLKKTVYFKQKKIYLTIRGRQ